MGLVFNTTIAPREDSHSTTVKRSTTSHSLTPENRAFLVSIGYKLKKPGK